MSDEYPDVHLFDPIDKDCVHADKIPAAMLRGPYMLRILKNSPFKGKPFLASKKQDVLDFFKKSDLHVCKEELGTFAAPRAPLRAIINSKCSAKIRVRCSVSVGESPAFLVIPPGEHQWQAMDEEYTWDMDESDSFVFPTSGILSEGFGSLSNVRLEHEGDTVWARGTWTGPRSGVSYSHEFQRPCVGVINSERDHPYVFYLGFSPQISDATFQESNPPDPGRPLSDNFNALDWKKFWHYKTFSPKEAFPIGVWTVNIYIYSYGKI